MHTQVLVAQIPTAIQTHIIVLVRKAILVGTMSYVYTLYMCVYDCLKCSGTEIIY